MSHPQLFRFDTMQFLYTPFPIGYGRGVLADDIYQELAESYPAQDLFSYMPKLGKKYSLSELNNPRQYQAFLDRSPRWRQLHDEIKSHDFAENVLDTLIQHHIDLGLRGRVAVINDRRSAWERRVADAWSCLRSGCPRRKPLKSRFEFSMLPADEGNIKPHTDSPNKLITLVISLMREGEWNPQFGGGTSMLQPKSERHAYNHLNEYLQFDQTEEIHTFPFDPNQCVLFIKTFNSLHGVRPMSGTGSPLMRKTLTINLETY